MQEAVSSPACSQRELPLLKRAGRAGPTWGRGYGGKESAHSTRRGDPGEGVGWKGKGQKAAFSPTGHFPRFFGIASSFKKTSAKRKGPLWAVASEPRRCKMRGLLPEPRCGCGTVLLGLLSRAGAASVVTLPRSPTLPSSSRPSSSPSTPVPRDLSVGARRWRANATVSESGSAPAGPASSPSHLLLSLPSPFLFLPSPHRELMPGGFGEKSVCAVWVRVGKDCSSQGRS